MLELLQLGIVLVLAIQLFILPELDDVRMMREGFEDKVNVTPLLGVIAVIH